MKKQKIQSLILLLVLVALAGVFFGLRKYNEIQADKTIEEDEIVVIDANSGEVVNLIYDYEGETFHFEKEDGVWYLADDHSRTAKSYYINSMLSGVAPLTATKKLEKVTDLGQYGLDNPQRTIIFDTDIQRFKIYVGDNNSMISSCYIQLSDQPETVYIIPQSYINRFNYGLDTVLEEIEEEEAGADE